MNLIDGVELVNSSTFPLAETLPKGAITFMNDNEMN